MKPLENSYLNTFSIKRYFLGKILLIYIFWFIVDVVLSKEISLASQTYNFRKFELDYC